MRGAYNALTGIKYLQQSLKKKIILHAVVIEFSLRFNFIIMYYIVLISIVFLLLLYKLNQIIVNILDHHTHISFFNFTLYYDVYL